MDIITHVDLVRSFFCQPAWADSLTEIKKWLYSTDNIENHVDRTQTLLMDAVRDTLKYINAHTINRVDRSTPDHIIKFLRRNFLAYGQRQVILRCVCPCNRCAAW